MLTIGAIGSGLTKDPSVVIPQGIWTLTFLLSVIVIVIIYHKIFACRFSYLSLGERLAGKELTNEKKVWINRYDRNRLGLFLIIMFNIISLGNIWDALSYGYYYEWETLIGKVLRIGVITNLMLSMIQGKLNSLMVLICIQVLTFGIGLLVPSSLEFRSFFMLTGIINIAFYIFVYVIYKGESKKEKSVMEEA